MSNLAFNETFYLTTYPDVLTAIISGQLKMTAQEHFNQFGWKEQRNPNQYFNTTEYLLRYADVRNARVNPLDHFLTNGVKEGRLPNSNIDGTIDVNNDNVANDFASKAYTDANPDVKAAVDAGQLTAYQHYVLFGQFEGRTGFVTGAGGAVTPITGPFVNGGTTGGVTGSTIALTKGTDALSGTTGNDTFSAVLQAAGADGTTISPGDSLTGLAGTDTLSISVAGAAAGGYTLSAVQTTGIEKLLVSNFDTDNGETTVATALMNGLTTVGLSASSETGDTTFSGLANLVAAEMRNGAGDVTLGYNASVVAGTADSQTLTVSAVSGGTFKADGVETVAVKAELVASTLTALTSNKLETLTVTGDKDLTISTGLIFAKTADGTAIDGTVDASAFTGKLSVNVSGSVSTVKVTGGTADDTIAMGATLKTTDVIDGGAGNDRLTMTAANLTNQFTNVKNIETVAFNAIGTEVAFDASKLSTGVTTVEVDLFDNSDDDTLVASTISNLSTQAVVVKHSTTDTGGDTGGNDGVTLTITGQTDTAADSIGLTLDAVGVKGDNNDAVSTTDQFGIDKINVATFETVNLASKKSATVTANQVAELVDTNATKLVLTGDADLTLTTTSVKYTSVDASALDGKLNLALANSKASVVLTAKDDTLTLAGLTADDTINGGAGADTLTATGVTGLTATTGKLNISNVETVVLTTTGNNTLDLANVKGATSLSVVADTQTITGLDLATKLIAVGDATFAVTAANAAGTDDTLTVERRLTANADGTNTVEAKGGSIENLAIILNDQQATTANKATFTLTNFEGKKVSVTQSAASLKDAKVDLGTLNKSVTTVDMSGVKGTQAASAANATAAVTFSLAGADVATVTGSALADTFNIASTGAKTHSITGGGGTDTTNIAVKAGFENASGIATENLNITVNAGDTVTLAAGFHADTTDIALAGGNSVSVFNMNTQTLADGVKTFNASSFGGDITVGVVANKLDDTVTITGGVSTKDTVSSTYSTAGSYNLKTTGVETISVEAGNGAANETFTIGLSSTSGVKTVVVGNIATGAADTVIVDKITDQLVQVAKSSLAANIIEAKLASATGAADIVNFELKDAANNIVTGLILKTTDVETVNIKVSSAESISLAQVSITEAGKFMAVNLTGDKALTITALNEDVNVLNASGMTTGGSVILTDRSGTTAATYTGSAGDDSFIMKNAADVISGGEGIDSLKITFNQAISGLRVDLNATGDQVTTLDGEANAAVQSGFESVDLSGITGNFGANITAKSTGSTITGTLNADQITGGAGVDTIKYTVSTTGVAGSDNIIAFKAGVGGDIIDITATATTTFQSVTGAVVDLSGTNAVTANFLNNADNQNLSASTGGGGAAATHVIVEIGSGLATLSDLSVAGFRALFGTGGAKALTTDANDDFSGLIAVYNGTGADASAALFYVNTATATDTAKSIASGDTVTLIGTFAGIGSNSLTFDNFL